MEPDAEQFTIIFKIIGLFLLILLSGFFSSAETAFMSVDKIKIRNFSKLNNKSAQRVEELLHNKSKLLSTILIGNNFINLFASSITTTIVYDMYGDFMVSIATGILTMVILIFGEILPKNIANKYAEYISMKYSFIISILMKLFTPFIIFTNIFNKLGMKLFKIDETQKEKIITEEDFKVILDVSQEEGILENEEHKIIHNVMGLGDFSAKDIMVPRVSIVGVNITDTFDTIIKTFKKEQYTRLVVYNKAKTDIVGIINVRDMICIDDTNFDINKCMRKPYITYEYKNVADLLTEMKQTSNNIAIVIDEYGCIAGLLTLEDILEEVVGEIRDEYDEDELKQIVQIDENNYIINGNIKIIDLNKHFNILLTSEEYDTICGYCIEQLNAFPNVNDIINLENMNIQILEITNNHIEKIKIEFKSN